MAESRRAANKIKCRQRILKASRRLFRAKGYDNTMIEDVADKAGVSKATLYNYFPNKESLLVGTAEDEATCLETYIHKELRHVEDSEQKLRAAMAFLITDSIPFMDVSRRILYLNSCKESPLFKAGRGIREQFYQLIAAVQEEGIFKKEIETEDILDLLMGVYLNSQFQWEDIEAYTEQHCMEKVNHILDLTLAGIYS